jgi:hypothetical protein
MTAEPKVLQNQLLAGRLGWTPNEIVAGELVIDADFVVKIAARQTELGVTADGVCGPVTYSAVLVHKQAELATGSDATKLERAGQITVCEAKRVWLRTIVDLPPAGTAAYETSRSTIDQMIRTSLGLGWDWEPEYRKNYEWCGAFCAYSWRAGGIPLAMRKSFFSSTYRLDRWARYQPFEQVQNPRPAQGPYRSFVELDEHSTPADVIGFGGTGPRAGDILLVGGVNTAYGKHITVVESYDAVSGWFVTLEGNGTALGPGGQRQHGVVRARRRIGLDPGAPSTTYFARRVLRPSVRDLA